MTLAFSQIRPAHRQAIPGWASRAWSRGVSAAERRGVIAGELADVPGRLAGEVGQVPAAGRAMQSIDTPRVRQLVQSGRMSLPRPQRGLMSLLR